MHHFEMVIIKFDGLSVWYIERFIKLLPDTLAPSVAYNHHTDE